MILDDNVYGGNVTFTARLDSVTGADQGSPSMALVTITENDALPPDLAITNPPSTITVSETTTTFTVQGVANANNWAGMLWSNSLTGASGQIPMGYYWSVPDIALGAGTNLITITATNQGGSGASDSGSDSAYLNGWDISDNGGFGWGGWQLYTSSTNVNLNGRFMANSAAVNVGTPAWGLYANNGNGNLSEAKRLMTNALAVGQTLAVRMDNGFLNPGSGVGVAVQNSTGTTLWEFFFNGGDTYYSMSSTTTDIGWTSGGIDVEFTLTAPTSFVTRITPIGGNTRTNTGNLIAAADSSITVFRAWNFNAGSGSDYDAFFNNLTLSAGTGSGPSTSATVQIIRTVNNSQIPQDWRDRYNLNGPGSDDQGDLDGDGYSNLEEYWADSVPTNSGSLFGKVQVKASNTLSSTVITVDVMPPTTNSRLYDVSYATNLVNSTWTPSGLNVPGRADGGGLSFTVTNASGSILYFRSRVFAP